MQFRNQINQQQQQQNTSIVTPDVLNVNQQHFHQHDIVENGGGSNTNYNNLNASAMASAAVAAANAINNQQYLVCGTGAAEGTLPPGQQSNNHQSSSIMNNINSYNFDLNELKQPKTTTKMLQKSSTGGSKRVRQIGDREQNNLGSGGGAITNSVGGPLHDLNLASTVTRHDSKSSAKLFDDLKENVYLEVSALIAANETRPHFLINLFRELQLISTSDPLRKRLMQAFQEVYSQYCEANPSSLQEEQLTSQRAQVGLDLFFLV